VLHKAVQVQVSMNVHMVRISDQHRPLMDKLLAQNHDFWCKISKNHDFVKKKSKNYDFIFQL
jgi:hypothetical protein